MKYNETKEFQRDLKKLLKKYPSLKDDLKITKQYAIELYHLQNIDQRSIFQIEGAGNNQTLQFYKIKKFACRSLKNQGANSGIRITYAYSPQNQEVCFLEIYFKGKKVNEDRGRIENFITNAGSGLRT